MEEAVCFTMFSTRRHAIYPSRTASALFRYDWTMLGDKEAQRANHLECDRSSTVAIKADFLQNDAP